MKRAKIEVVDKHDILRAKRDYRNSFSQIRVIEGFYEEVQDESMLKLLKEIKQELLTVSDRDEAEKEEFVGVERVSTTTVEVIIQKMLNKFEFVPFGTDYSCMDEFAWACWRISAWRYAMDDFYLQKALE